MDELFGISMNLIMYVLLGVLGVSLASIALVALRNRVMFKLGVRNIPRRKAQTSLIVIGLMLSTVIIAAAFATGDTVDRSITSEAYTLLGSMDEVIQVRVGNEDEGFDDPSQGVVREESFSEASVSSLIETIASYPEVDAVVPGYSDLAVAVNLEERLSSPLFTVLGLDPERSRELPDIEDVRGGRLRLDDLAAGEIYVNESAAEELNVRAGDAITIITRGSRSEFRVKAVVEDRRLAGSGGISARREGGVLPLATAQELFGSPGRLTLIAVSNKGDARAGVKYSAAVEERIEGELATLRQREGAPRLFVVAIKQIGVDFAELFANIFTSFFLVLGLFSIAAGILLIFMIFVMLAAERKPEMGMARAVGTKRFDLVQIFLSEGMSYNVLAAMVGTGLGVLVAFAMARIMAAIFAQFDISISPHVTFRSLAVSYALGVVLTFLTVTFSSWRVSYINIVRAIRDIPEPSQPRPRWRARGFFSTLLGLVVKRGSRRSWAIRGGLLLSGLVLQVGAGSAGVTELQIAAGMLGGLAIAVFVFLTFQIGFLFVIGGVPLIYFGASELNAFALLFGLSLAPIGLALIIRSFGFNERIAYTAAGVFLIYIWEIDFSVGLVERIFGEVEGDIEMFFLSGVMVTVAATFIVVYNADLILGPLTRLGRGLGALLPSMKMAVAYPLASKMRTGLTMAMFCLVVFALTVMSSMNYNFNRLFLSDRSLGGWDVYVDENPTNPIDDLKAELAAAGSPAASQIQAVGVTSFVTQRNARLCQEVAGRDCGLATEAKAVFNSYAVRGEDAAFLANAELPLQTRARGYSSDDAVWQAVAADPSFGVIDSIAITGDFGPAVVEGVQPGDREMDPVTLTVRDAITGNSRTIMVIGVIEMGASNNFNGLHVSEATLTDVFGEPDSRRHYVKTVAGANDRQVAREIESVLLTTGAQSESLRYEADQLASTQNGFFYLMQGFMGLGLFVGVAAVGVIAFRTVVERRQQIGMLRALGYTRRMIGLTFLMESAFISFMGVLSGVVFALILARQLITEEFANQGVSSFAVPWLQIGVIAGLAFGSAVLMTLIPSRQAAHIPIAQALRYE
ncbi:MAG TPA: FtsX-like permease family protein [Dehalococcoidia bacterium]